MAPPLLFDLGGMDLERVLLGPDQIRRYNPHRYEMEQLGGVLHLDRQKGRIVAFKDVRADEFWVRGHIPGRPLMPGVLMIESAAQMISYFTKTVTKIDGFIGFGGVTDVKFRGQVLPGMKLVLAGKLIELRPRRAVGLTQGFVDGTMVYEGTITGMLI